MTIPSMLSRWCFSVPAHLNARLDVLLRVHELICGIEEHDLFGLWLAQVKYNDLTVDGHLKKILLDAHLMQVWVFTIDWVALDGEHG